MVMTRFVRLAASCAAMAALAVACPQNDPPSGPASGLPPVASPPAGGGAARGGSLPPRGGRGGSRSGAAARSKVQVPADQRFDWDRWWELNDDRFQRARARIRVAEAHTTDADAQLGAAGRPVVERVTEKDLARDILPAVRKVAKDPFFGARRQAAIALGKIADDRREDVRETLRAMVADVDWEVRTGACLGLGLQGSLDALPLLASVMKDAPEARRYCGLGDARLSPRERGYAAIALGCVGMESGLLDTSANDLVAQVLAKETHPDPRVFAALALGVVHAHAAADELRRVAFTAAEPEVVRAHAVVAIGKLGDAGALDLLIRQGLSDKSAHVQRSAAIAIGLLAKSSDGPAVEALVAAARSAPDRGVKNFATMALGQVGGRAGRDALFEQLRRGHQADRTFGALALGVLAFHAPEERKAIGQKLLAAFVESRSDDERAAYAIALGLADCRTSVAPIEKALQSGGSPELVEHLCTALGLLGDRSAIPVLQSALERANDGGVIMKAAIALGAIGDPTAVAVLTRVFQQAANSQAALLGATLGLGFIGDRSAVAPLVFALESRLDITRAYAAMALGVLGDKRDFRTLAAIQENANYLAVTEWLPDVLALY